MASAEGSAGDWGQGTGSTSIRRVAEAWWVGERGRLHRGGELSPTAPLPAPWACPALLRSPSPPVYDPL